MAGAFKEEAAFCVGFEGPPGFQQVNIGRKEDVAV